MTFTDSPGRAAGQNGQVGPSDGGADAFATPPPPEIPAERCAATRASSQALPVPDSGERPTGISIPLVQSLDEARHSGSLPPPALGAFVGRLDGRNLRCPRCVGLAERLDGALAEYARSDHGEARDKATGVLIARAEFAARLLRGDDSDCTCLRDAARLPIALWEFGDELAAAGAADNLSEWSEELAHVRGDHKAQAVEACVLCGP